MAKDKELKYRVSVDDEASGPLKDVSREQEELAKGTQRAGEATTRASRASEQASGRLTAMATATRKASQGWAAMLGLIRGLLGPVLGIGAATAAIQANTRAMNENAKAANALKEAQLDLQFLSQGHRPDELLAVRQAAEIAGGKNAELEMSAAFGQLKSQTPHLNDEERMGFFRQLTETSLTTSASPTDLVELFSKGSLHVSDPGRLQNIMRKTQELSPETSPQKLAQLLPRVLPLGPDMDAEPEQIAGLAVTAMNAAGTPDEGITALRSILLSLQGKENPEASRIMRRAGARPGMDVLEQLATLSEAQRSGGLDLGGIETVVGTEGSTVLSGLLRGHDTLRSNIAEIVGAGQGETDLTAESIRNIIGEDEQQALRLITRQAEARAASIQARDIRAQRREAVKQILDAEMRALEAEGTISPARRVMHNWAYSAFSASGMDPETAAGLILPQYDIPERVTDTFEAGPNLDVSQIGRGGQTIIQNQTNIEVGENYNFNDDGFTRFTEPAPEEMD